MLQGKERRAIWKRSGSHVDTPPAELISVLSLFPRFSGLFISRSLAEIFVLSVCSSVTQAVGPVKLKKFGV